MKDERSNRIGFYITIFYICFYWINYNIIYNFFLVSTSKNKENSSNNNSNNLDMEDFLNSRYENNYNNVKKSNHEDDNNDPIRRL